MYLVQLGLIHDEEGGVEGRTEGTAAQILPV